MVLCADGGAGFERWGGKSRAASSKLSRRGELQRALCVELGEERDVSSPFLLQGHQYPSLPQPDLQTLLYYIPLYSGEDKDDTPGR